jgi:transcriptional regulator with XRE-family HTH domain
MAPARNPVRVDSRVISTLSRDVALRVSNLRQVHGLSQNELERRAGLAIGMVSRIESGERGRLMTIDVALRLAMALFCDVGYLITGGGHAGTPFTREIMRSASSAPGQASRDARPPQLQKKSQKARAGRARPQQLSLPEPEAQGSVKAKPRGRSRR